MAEENLHCPAKDYQCDLARLCIRDKAARRDEQYPLPMAMVQRSRFPELVLAAAEVTYCSRERVSSLENLVAESDDEGVKVAAMGLISRIKRRQDIVRLYESHDI
jgi:hypothetical protein